MIQEERTLQAHELALTNSNVDEEMFGITARRYPLGQELCGHFP